MKDKYIQKNKGVFVRLSPETMEIVKRNARDRRWSKAQLVRWCVEQWLGCDPLGCDCDGCRRSRKDMPTH